MDNQNAENKKPADEAVAAPANNNDAAVKAESKEEAASVVTTTKAVKVTTAPAEEKPAEKAPAVEEAYTPPGSRPAPAAAATAAATAEAPAAAATAAKCPVSTKKKILMGVFNLAAGAGAMAVLKWGATAAIVAFVATNPFLVLVAVSVIMGGASTVMHHETKRRAEARKNGNDTKLISKANLANAVTAQNLKAAFNVVSKDNRKVFAISTGLAFAGGAFVQYVVPMDWFQNMWGSVFGSTPAPVPTVAAPTPTLEAAIPAPVVADIPAPVSAAEFAPIAPAVPSATELATIIPSADAPAVVTAAELAPAAVEVPAVVETTPVPPVVEAAPTPAVEAAPAPAPAPAVETAPAAPVCISPLDKFAQHVQGTKLSGGVVDAMHRSVSDNAVVAAQGTKDLAYYTYNGFGGVPKDASIAAELFQKAADAGNVQAKTDLLYLQFHGLVPVAPNPQAAVNVMSTIKTPVADQFVQNWKEMGYAAKEAGTFSSKAILGVSATACP